jgi:hypothetical protein
MRVLPTPATGEVFMNSLGHPSPPRKKCGRVWHSGASGLTPVRGVPMARLKLRPTTILELTIGAIGVPPPRAGQRYFALRTRENGARG